MTDLVTPLGRQGPGRLPPDAVARLKLGVLRRAGGMFTGEHRSAGLGDGTELAQLRPYEAGDDVRKLDPAASARTAVPHVRLHVPERSVTTWIVVDVSPSMAFGTADRLKSDVAEGVVEAVGRLAVRHGGRVALTVGGPASPATLPPRSGRSALAALRHVARAGVVADGSPRTSSLGDALTRVVRLARGPGVVVVVSDFRDAGWSGPLRRVAAKHTVVAVEVVDPREGALPDVGELCLVDPETGDEAWIDTTSAAVRSAVADAEAARRADVAAALRRAGALSVTLDTSGDWLRELGRRLR